MATRNGYDDARVGLLTELPFPDASFDYVVSLDVFGHIGFDEKDLVLQEIKRVLRPDGVTMHGIESLDPKLHPDYGAMSPEKWAQFIGVDGHIGLETDEEIANRFARVFSSVQSEPRYTLCLSVAELIKQFDQYGAPFDADFIDYLRGLSFDERRAFDLAMGYVFGKISDLHVKLPSSGLYLLLKATNAAPEPLYNAHRDRSDLFSKVVFGNGWYPANHLPPIARWMSERSWLEFEAESCSRLRLQLTTHIPDLRTSPMELEFRLNGERICGLCLFEYGWLDLEIDVTGSGKLRLEIKAGRTWQPCKANPESGDDRHLSIAVCNLEVI
jgi:SAM-dependent methyltransferase